MNFEEITRKVKKISRDTVEEVQKLNEIRQLNGKISDARKQVDSTYLTIGKKLFDMYREEPIEGFESEISSINDKMDLIKELQEQVRHVKGVVLCPCCNMEVPASERFCSNCGNKMPEIFEIVDGDEDAVMVESEDVTGRGENAQTEEETAEPSEAAKEPAAEAVGNAEDVTEKPSEADCEDEKTCDTAAEPAAEE